MGIAKSQRDTRTVTERIAWISAQNSDAQFCSLMHHYNVDALRDCFHSLDGKKAVGADGMRKQDYGEQLEANLQNLLDRMKRMAYRPNAPREVLIPKEGKPGATRPLGISNFEDKLVQKRTQQLLEAIYDPIFVEQSYGFRPGRSCHDAIKAVRDYADRNRVSVVIDVDLANFFGTIDHDILIELLEIKIKDTRFMRYIRRMLKAGILAKGAWRMSEEGMPQGSCCSPVLANIFAHYVIDKWFNETVKRHIEGKAEMVRYADDMVIMCEYAHDARRINAALKKRLA